MGVNRLLKKKESIKDFFEINKWSTGELDGYWTGGMVGILFAFCEISLLILTS